MTAERTAAAATGREPVPEGPGGTCQRGGERWDGAAQRRDPCPLLLWEPGVDRPPGRLSQTPVGEKCRKRRVKGECDSGVLLPPRPWLWPYHSQGRFLCSLAPGAADPLPL